MADFSADNVETLLGPIGRSAHARGDLVGVARAVNDAPAAGAPDRVATFVRLFLLGHTLADADVRAALEPLALDAAIAAGIVEADGDDVRAGLEIRPYAEAGTPESWWVVSDLGSDVRRGPLAHDHVLGVGQAAVTLSQATPRHPVTRALDLGTGCGVQALHLSGHSRTVTASDISRRALRFAATTAALSGQRWDLRQGSFLDPVTGEKFDLVVANPPFVVSPGPDATGSGRAAEYDYRDSGLAGDEVCRSLVRRLPSVLAPGGTAQLLANWIIPTDGDWRERVAGWFSGSGCDAWVWQREVADPAEYVTMWLRDAGYEPGDAQWTTRYHRWLDWFETHGVAAVGMGLITMEAGGRDHSVTAGGVSRGEVVFDDVRQVLAQPIGAEISAWFTRHRQLSDTSSRELLSARYDIARDLVLTRDDLLVDDAGWQPARAVLRQSHGMRWELEVDDAVGRIVAAVASGASPATALEVLAAVSDEDPQQLADAFAPVLRDLVQRGFLLPAGPR